MNIESLLLKLKKSYERNIPEINAYRKKLYPDFVFNSHLETIRDEIPVFTFHIVEPIQFEKQLQFLADNDYKTLTADDFLEMLLGHKSIPERSVLLTFDDGWGSLWTYAYPLLKKYGMQGVCFIIPGVIDEGESSYPNLNDVWQGRISQEQLVERETTFQPYCTWQEIREMSSDGTIDFQSHTLYHSKIFTSSEIVDFFNPSFDSYFGNHNIPVIRTNGIDNWSRKIALGTPIYAHIPRMGGKRRYFDDEELREQCIQLVNKNGGSSFFQSTGWIKQLRKLVTDYKEKIGEQGFYETNEELKKSIYWDLQESKRLIEKNLPNKTVKHLCYPYFVGSELALEISREVGYSCNYWGFLTERRGNCPGDDPYRIVRLSDELIFRLPGSGRKSLQNILGQKIVKNSQRFFNNLTKVDDRRIA